MCRINFYACEPKEVFKINHFIFFIVTVNVYILMKTLSSSPNIVHVNYTKVVKINYYVIA